MKWALYDLKFNPPSFDIFAFIQYAKHYGAEGIWLKPGYNGNGAYKDHAGERHRVKTIVIPAIELYGFTWQLGGEVPEAVWPPNEIRHFAHQMRFLDRINEIALPHIPQGSLDRANDRFKGKRPVVVILRNQGHQPYRNSGDGWERWAQEHEAEVIRDYPEDPMPLSDRIACYELAACNFGVNSGNMAPNYFSKRPYLSMKWLADGKYKKHSIEQGYQFPWATSSQKLVWNSVDDYRTVENEYCIYVKGLSD